MDFRILGPLEVLDEGRAVPLGGSRRRALLALLLLHVNEPLGLDRLIDELWGERPPAGAAKTLQVQISRLRKALGGDSPIVTREHGYELAVDPDRIDARRFERLAADGGRELAAGEPERAAETLERALGLWRGAALADVAYEPFAQAEIARLDELRGAALEQQVEAELALGRHAGVVGRLQGLIADHPYRERLRGQLMLALYRCDRQADALQAFQDARGQLVDELGIEPGSHLRELEQAILAQDPALAAPATKARPAAVALTPGRRPVTVLATGLTGAERLDPESQHALLVRCSGLVAQVVERHGGTVDRMVGLFGLRALHEDDALRAVRAAVELRAAWAADGSATAVRAGIGSGELYVGADAVATGEAVTVAARLEEAAAPGEILLADATHRLVAPHVDAEAAGPARRLVALRSEARLAPPTPFVGRARELAQLREAVDDVRRRRACRMVTVVGPAGIGKSRLARELAADVSGEAAVVAGRCLSYGDGITFRPLAEIVRRLAPGDPRRALSELLGGEDEVVRRVLAAVGLAEEPAAAAETFWAVRRLLEAAARPRPLVAIVEDAHWAEPTLLDLLEYVVSFSSGAPILLLCLARPELLESRPAWAAPQPGRGLLVLDALSDAQARAFVGTLGLEPDDAARIVATAEGNPLFLEQLVAVQDLATLPPSIEAVLAARIDRLEPAERAVLVHASVEGRTFHRGAVAELVPAEARGAVMPSLMGLVRKQLVRPDRPEFPGEDAFRFAHALIREAAYAGLPKRLRADLHERLGRWFEDRPGVPDELIGYHLEQAYRSAAAVGRADRAVAATAADRLAAGASAALARGDAAAGARLLERALALTPERPGLRVTLGAALAEAGRLAEAERVLAEAVERDGARAAVEQELVRLHAGTSRGLGHARGIADAALAQLDDHLGRCRAWRLRASADWTESQAARADGAWRRAADHAVRAGDERERFDILAWRASAAAFGPTPVPDAIRVCTEIRDQVRASPLAVALTLHPLGLLHAMAGELDAARGLIREADALLGELGRMESAVSHHAALVEMLAGRPAAAEACLRPGYERLARMGEQALLATTAALLAVAVLAQDRREEADALCGTSERIAAREDVATQAMWRGVRARIRARRGELGQAERLGREAVRLADPTDLLVVRGDALLDLAEVLALASRPADAEAAARRALALYDRKGSRVSAARARSRLTAMAPA